MNIKKTIWDVISKYCKEQNRSTLVLLLGGIAMILMLGAELLPSEKKTARQASVFSSADYQQQLETQLEELISQMNGAGKTTVMVTLETGEETVYALDTRMGEAQEQKTHVLLDDGTALTETIYLPQVCGVAILCEGGADVRIIAHITEMVSSLFDIPSNRVCVEQRKP